MHCMNRMAMNKQYGSYSTTHIGIGNGNGMMTANVSSKHSTNNTAKRILANTPHLMNDNDSLHGPLNALSLSFDDFDVSMKQRPSTSNTNTNSNGNSKPGTANSTTSINGMSNSVSTSHLKPLPARQEMNLRTSARKEAYDILRSSKDMRSSYFVNNNTNTANTNGNGNGIDRNGSLDDEGDIDAAVSRIAKQFQQHKQHNPSPPKLMRYDTASTSAINAAKPIMIKRDDSIIFENLHLPTMKVDKRHAPSPTRASFQMFQQPLQPMRPFVNKVS